MKVLIVRVGAMGDVLHALPAVAALRVQHPGWQIDWVVDPRWRPLLVNDAGGGPIVNTACLAETKLWSRAPFSLRTARSVRELRRELRAGQYDLAVDMQGTIRSAVIAWLSGAPVRVGFADPREQPARWFFTRSHPVTSRHIIARGAELLDAACGSSGLRLAPLLHPLALPHEPWADDWAAGEAADSRLALLSPGAGWGAKQWPAFRFAELARALHGSGFDVVVTAPRKEDELAGRVVGESQGAARLLVSNVSGLVALTRRAALVVGGDTGPIHLAAALDIPLVALFGPTDPARNGPLSPGPLRVLRHPASVTSYRHVPGEDPGLRQISVEEVLQACKEVVSRREPHT